MIQVERLKRAIQELEKIKDDDKGSEVFRDALTMLGFDLDMVKKGLPYYLDVYGDDNQVIQAVSGQDAREIADRL